MKLVRMIGKISSTLWMLVLLIGCQLPAEEQTPNYDTYPNPTDDTEYVLLENGILLPSYWSYSRGIEGGVGEFVLCGYEQCSHSQAYIAQVYYLFGEEAFSKWDSSGVHLWIDSRVEDLKLHSNRMAGDEFVGLDENGYYWTNIREYRYMKFPQKNETCFWLQIAPHIFENFDSFEFRIRVYDGHTGVYYESEQYQLQFVGDRKFIVNILH